MSRLLRVAAAVSCLTLHGLALAQDGTEPTPAQIRAAAEAFDLGREAYQRDDYVNAAEQFERADSQAPSETALEYAIRARDKAQQLDRAATLAVLARERHPNGASLSKLVPGLIERAKRELYELTVTCAEPCELAVGGKIVHGMPARTRVVYLPAGEVTVRAGFSEDRGTSATVRAVAGAQGSVHFDVPVPEPAPAVTPPPAPPPPVDVAPQAEASSGWSPTVFWIGAGLTVAAGAATIWSGVDTLNNPGEERVGRECPRGDTSCPLYQQGLESQRRTNILIGVTAGLGVGTILVGTLWTDWGARDERTGTNRKQTASRVRPWLQVGEGALVGAEGRF